MILHNHPLAAFHHPTRNEIHHHMYVVHRRHEALVDVWCTVDGICFLIQSPPDRTTQIAFYSGKIKYTCAWLAFTDYGYGFFWKYRNVNRSFALNYGVKP
jgi:hypothetical protein